MSHTLRGLIHKLLLCLKNWLPFSIKATRKLWLFCIWAFRKNNLIASKIMRDQTCKHWLIHLKKLNVTFVRNSFPLGDKKNKIYTWRIKLVGFTGSWVCIIIMWQGLKVFRLASCHLPVKNINTQNNNMKYTKVLGSK